MFDSGADALRFIASGDVAMVDLKVVGVGGQWLHLTIPAARFGAKHLEQGVGFDGSSGSGYAQVESGDVAALPVIESAFLDPFFEKTTLSFLCRVVSADTGEPVSADPRGIAERAEAHLRHTGVADQAWMAPEYEFSVFDAVQVRCGPYDTRVRIASHEADGRDGGVAIPHQGGYLRVPPGDQLHDLRTEIASILLGLGVPVRYHHHEVGAAGQCELEVALEPLVRAADHAMLAKYVIKNVARRRGKLATFMPKPIFGEAGNGMHVHQRLTRAGRPVFFDSGPDRYADLSDVALYYISGILMHGRALAGITNPSTNSYKRLVEGYEAPVHLFFGLANRAAAVRVPRYAVRPDEKRIEYRPPDFTGNVYLSLAAMLMAGIDGIARRSLPRDHYFGPYEFDLSTADAEFRARIAALPRTLEEALDSLRADHEFLTAGDVFTPAFLSGWMGARLRQDARAVAVRPHPYEYQLYLDT